MHIGIFTAFLLILWVNFSLYVKINFRTKMFILILLITLTCLTSLISNPLIALVQIMIIGFIFLSFLFCIYADKFYLYSLIFILIIITPLGLFFKLTSFLEFIFSMIFILLVGIFVKDLINEKIFK